MRCTICRAGQTQPGTGTVTLTRGELTVVFKRVPAEVCENCGEQYFDESTSERLLEQVGEAERAGVQVEIREYVAA